MGEPPGVTKYLPDLPGFLNAYGLPTLAPNLDDPDWLTLEDLIPPSPRRGEGRVRGEADRARVTEVSEAGSVPFLQVASGAPTGRSWCWTARS